MKKSVTTKQLKKNSYLQWTFWAMAIILLVPFSKAQTATLAPVSYGTVTTAGVQVASSLTGIEELTSRRGWFKFDLSSIPAGAIINSANLTYSTAAGTVNSGSAVNKLNMATDDLSLLTGTTLFGRCLAGGATSNLFTGSWSGTHPLLLQTDGPTGGNATVAASLVTYLSGQQSANFACFTLVRGSTNSYNFAVPSLSITYTVPSPCAGTPAPGNTLSTSAAVCSGVNFTLSLQNSTAGTGVTYQWQSSADNITYSNVAGATGASLTTNITSATYFQCIVTCSAGPSSATSTPIQITMNSFANCYCTPTTTNGCNSGDHITNVTFTSLVSPINNNTGTCLVNSYSDYTSTVTAAEVTLGDVVPVTVHVGNGGTEYAGLWIDFDHSGTFDASEFLALSTPSNAGAPDWQFDGSITIPNTALTGTTRMRVRSSYNTIVTGTDACTTFSYGETEDYFVNISNSSVCSGTPAPGNTLSTAASICTGVNFTLSLQTPTLGSGITYQWQSSSDNVTYTDITGATSSTLTTNISSSTYFQCVVTCSAGPNSGTSTPVQVTLNSFVDCYCTSGATNTSDEEIFSVTVNGSTNAYDCLTTAPGAGSILNQYSNFHPLGSLTSVTQGDVVSFSIIEDECDGATYYDNGCAVWIDFNQNGDFTDAGEQVYIENTTTLSPRTIAGSFAVPLTALTGVTGMRIVVAEGLSDVGLTPCITYGYGETEDYLITINAASNCTGTPAPGNTLTSLATVCPTTSFTLSLQNNVGATGITYQWQSSPDNITYTDIAGATTPIYTTTQSAAAYYQCVVTCSAGPSTGTSTPVQVTMAAVANCYCIPSTTNGGASGDAILGFISADMGYNYTTTVATPSPGYVDLTTTVGTAFIGASYYFEIDETDSGDASRIWVDFNDNGSFEDAGELLATTGTGSIVTGSITIPFSAPIGNHRLRIRNSYDFVNAISSTPSCSTTNTYGETKDFTISIVPAYDITLDNIFSPSTTGCYTNAETVSVTLQNAGLDTLDMSVNPVTVNCNVTGANPNNLTFVPVVISTGLIVPGGTYNVSFPTPYDMSAVGTYDITVTLSVAYDGSAANDSNNETYTRFANPTVTATASLPIVCEGSNETLSGGGASTYVWNNGVTNGVAFPASAATTTYNVTGTDIHGCTGTASATITVNTLPTVTATAAIATICQGASDTLVGGGAVSYSWDNGVTDGVGFYPNASTTYIVTGTDGNGCANTASTSITVNTAPVVTANTTAAAVCEGDNVTLTASGTATSYSWDNGVTDGVAFAPTATTMYMVTGTDAIGCTNMDMISITVNTLPAVTATAALPTVCEGSNETLTGGGALTYVWDNGVTDGVAFPASVATTTYMVTGTDGNGCVNTASSTITVNTLPTVTATAALTTICAGSSDTLTGGGASTYTWDNGVTDGVAFTSTATTTYMVTGTDANGCSNTATTTINVNPIPVVTLDAFNPSIVCDDLAPFALPAGLPAGGTYSGTGVTGTDYTPSPSIDGINTVTYSVTDLGCTGSASQNIEVSNCVSIHETTLANAVSIYPNPSNGMFTINITNMKSEELLITITDVQGREVYKSTEKNITADYVKQISMGNMSKGVYYIHLTNGTESTVQKLVTQ